jgi:hypothetical protein
VTRPPEVEKALAAAKAEVTRPQIELGFDYGPVLDAVEQALVGNDGGRPIYVWNNALARLSAASAHADPRIRETIFDEQPVVEVAPAPWLLERMTSVAEFGSWRKPANGDPILARAHPPERLSRMLAARGAWRHFRTLTGLIEAPCLRPDGSILDAAGHDAASGLVLLPRGTFPQIPERPTKDDARRALERLCVPLGDFPFLEPCDLSAALAAILTNVGRYSIAGPAPMFFFRSPIRGSGKTLLQKIVGVIGSGRMPAMRFNIRDPGEVRKQLAALAWAGVRYVAIDNVATGESFGNEVWAAALSTGRIEDRVLGKSETRSASLLGITFTGSGNNTTFRCDLGRRVVPVDIDPKCEQPEGRQDYAISPLDQWVVRNWRSLLVDALTVLRAHAVAGWPKHGGAPRGSFEVWDERVRGALIWAGMTDPAIGCVRIHDESDDDVMALDAVIREWNTVWGTEPVTLADVVATAHGHGAITDGQATALREALEEFANASPKRPLSATTLGYAMRAVRGRVKSGLRFVQASKLTGDRRWKLEFVSASGGAA